MAAPSHIVFHAADGWSHLKPLLALATRIAQRRFKSEVIMTLLASAQFSSKIQCELARVSGMTERLNVITFVDSNGEPPEVQRSRAAQEFAPAFAALWNYQPVRCHSTQRLIRGLPRPTLAIMDAFMTYAGDAVRAIAGTDCPLLVWLPTPVAPTLRICGPEELGGFGDLKGKIDAEASRSERPMEEIRMAVYRNCSAKVVRVPGLPDAYDYESFPQEDLVAVASFIQGAHRCLLAADGAIFAACSAFDCEALPAARQWLRGHKSSYTVWAVGPLEDIPVDGEVSKPSEKDVEILQFLSSMQAAHGELSVLFIAFGTMFYPKDPTKLLAFIEELLNMDVPFLWSHASLFTTIPDELVARIEASAFAHHASWVPQRAVLAHPATMWFVSHGGWNSVQEALGLRVPMVLWPFSGDQPHNAAILTLKHNAAFELLSVREGPATQPPLRAECAGVIVDFTVDAVRKEVRQLLVQIHGDEGARVRANANKLGEAMDASWKQDGEASAQLEALLRQYVDQA